MKDVKTFQWIKCKLLLSLPPNSLENCWDNRHTQGHLASIFSFYSATGKTPQGKLLNQRLSLLSACNFPQLAVYPFGVSNLLGSLLNLPHHSYNFNVIYRAVL